MKMKKMKARRKVREPRFCFKTMSDGHVLDDGYKWRKIERLVVGNTKNRFLVSFGNWPSLSCWTLNHMCNRVTCPWVLNMTRRLISFLLMRYKASTSLVLYLCFLVKSWC
ncbi:hypothetical protein JHK87_034161 [Glycine soja]|nr:hypothetical protein JHK87_034161 [Glycine soja]